ncbi:MAG: BolA family protein [Candidatus Porifericomitaceae bacterium WSBS_2022_MAG_OTU9]
MLRKFPEIEKIMRERLAKLSVAEMAISDDSHLHTGHGAEGVHISLYLLSSDFSGKTPVARHRMVYQLMADLMVKEIHALSIHAVSPEEKTEGN